MNNPRKSACPASYARGKEAILGCSELVAMRDRIEQLLADKVSSADVNFERQEYRKALISMRIHDCIHRDMAHCLLVSESDLQCCYECMTWCPKTKWRHHCGYHLQQWRDSHYEVILYHYAVIHPGYCPCCLWNQEIPADARLKYWLCSAGLKKHVEEEHIEKVEWQQLDSSVAAQNHLYQSVTSATIYTTCMV